MQAQPRIPAISIKVNGRADPIIIMLSNPKRNVIPKKSNDKNPNLPFLASRRAIEIEITIIIMPINSWKMPAPAGLYSFNPDLKKLNEPIKIIRPAIAVNANTAYKTNLNIVCGFICAGCCAGC